MDISPSVLRLLVRSTNLAMSIIDNFGNDPDVYRKAADVLSSCQELERLKREERADKQ